MFLFSFARWHKLVVALLSVLLTLAAASSSQAAQNGKIAFSSNRAGNYDLYLMDPDGSNVARLTSTPGDEVQPSWSPDGSKIVFVSDQTGNKEVYVLNADGSGLLRLTSTQSAREYSPAWSPDGKRIAFESNVSGSNEIYVMNVDGSNPTRLVSLPDRAESTDPAWSPDSTRVAFTIFSRPQGSGIDTVNADGSDLRVIVPQTGGAGDPAWALDGSRLVFSQLTPAASPLNIGQLFSLNIDGTNLVQLTNELMGENDQAIFSPDGTRIAFRSSRDGNNEIYVANGVGGDQLRVTRTLGDSNDPAWQPIIPPPPPPPPPPPAPRATNVAITKAAFTSNGSRRLLELSGSMTPVDAGGNVQITVSGLVPTHSKKKHGKVKPKNKLVQVKATAAIANGKWLTKLKLAKTFAKVRKVTIEVTYPGVAGTFLASPVVKKTVALKKAAKKHGRK